MRLSKCEESLIQSNLLKSAEIAVSGKVVEAKGLGGLGR